MKILFIIFLTFPLICWSQVGDTYLCYDETEQLGGVKENPVNAEFFFTWNDDNIVGKFTGEHSSFSINEKIVFQNKNDFITSSNYADGVADGRNVFIFNDFYDKGYLLRVFNSYQYHFVKKSVCRKNN